MKKKIPSALPLFGAAAAFVVCGMTFPMYKPVFILIAAAIAVLVALLVKKAVPAREVEIPLSTGDAEIDEKIAEGRARLEKLRAANDAIPDEEISKQLDRMDAAGRAIFDALEKKPEKARQVRKFLDYYLPTTEKLMEQYQTFMRFSASGRNVSDSMKSIEGTLSLVADAFEKQLDNLYRAEALDITSDVAVLETRLKAEGLSGSDFPKSEGGL